ncbi:MAG: hypothetical protein Q8J78_02940 [Moraxellaceae bacterium]|nr:hypothetical protein [Moraxellaceae bacterium]
MNAHVQTFLAAAVADVRRFLQLLALRHQPLSSPQAVPVMAPAMAQARARARSAAANAAQPSMASRRRQ